MNKNLNEESEIILRERVSIFNFFFNFISGQDKLKNYTYMIIALKYSRLMLSKGLV